METVSNTVEFNDGTVHYLSNGTGNDTVFFLHGISFNAGVWEKAGILSGIGRAGYHAIAADLPGYGESSPLELPDPELLSPAVDAMGIDSAVIVAPSFSGRFSLPFAIDNPSRAQGFVAVASRGIDANRDRLGEIGCSVLAIWGENDDVIPLEMADILVNAVPKGKKVVIPGGTHAPYLSDPERFVRELLAFLDTCFKGPELA